MIKQKLHILILLIFPILLHCKKEEPKPVKDLGFFPLNEAKSYLYFKPGSFWVYENLQTGDLDTVTVTQSRIDTIFSETSKQKLSFEDVRFSTKSSFFKNHTYDYFDRYPMTAENINFTYSYGFHKKLKINGLAQNNAHIFSWPCKLNNAPSQIFARCVEEIPTLTLQSNIQCSNVKVFKNPYDGTWEQGHGPTKYYWAESFGIVRREKVTVDNEIIESWELKNAELEQ